MERGSGARGIPAGEIRKSSKENLSHASLEKIAFQVHYL
jgi:hypothetical protein